MAETLLDVRGLACPLPVLRAKKTLKTMAPGEVLQVLSTDANTLKDIPAFCAQTGDELIDSTDEGGLYVFRIKRT